MKKRKKSLKKNMLGILECFLICLLMICVFALVWNVQLLQGTARVINYAGIVRGSTQRLVKLEIANKPNQELVKRLDRILIELRDGGENYHLSKITDSKYQECLLEQKRYWVELQDEIEAVREYGYEKTRIIDKSEVYYILADQTVSAAEEYSQRLADRLRIAQQVIALSVIGMLVILISRSVEAFRLSRDNYELTNKAYLDVSTGLSNKSRCEELIHQPGLLDRKTSLLVLDLNDLKKVNDSLGHIYGDGLIQNFARLLRQSVPDRDFVGRFGGDEFIVIMQDSAKDDILQVLERLAEYVDTYNRQVGDGLKLSYAVGWCHSSDYESITMKKLMEKADAMMYENKKEMKKKL